MASKRKEAESQGGLYIKAGAVVSGAGEVEGEAAGADVAAERGAPDVAEAALYHAPPAHRIPHRLQVAVHVLVHLSQQQALVTKNRLDSSMLSSFPNTA